MSILNLPSWDYPEGALKILRYPTAQTCGFDCLIMDATEEELNTAEEALKHARNAATRRSKILKELKRRRTRAKVKARSAWNEKFEKEWNDIRKAAGKI